MQVSSPPPPKPYHPAHRSLPTSAPRSYSHTTQLTTSREHQVQQHTKTMLSTLDTTRVSLYHEDQLHMCSYCLRTVRHLCYHPEVHCQCKGVTKNRRRLSLRQTPPRNTFGDGYPHPRYIQPLMTLSTCTPRPDHTHHLHVPPRMHRVISPSKSAPEPLDTSQIMKLHLPCRWAILPAR